MDSLLCVTLIFKYTQDIDLSFSGNVSEISVSQILLLCIAQTFLYILHEAMVSASGDPRKKGSRFYIGIVIWNIYGYLTDL